MRSGWVTWIFAFAALAVAALAGPARAQQAHDMALVGADDLQGRSAYQPTIHHQGARWIAYIGHHGGQALNPLTGRVEPNGTSIVDVTDPARPLYLAHIPGQVGNGEGGGAQMTRVCNGASLPHADRAKVYLLRDFGQLAHEMYDVTDPAHPRMIARLAGFTDTHKNWWECDTGVAYLVSGVTGWRTKRMTRVVDFSDPAHPVVIRDFGLVGQQPGATGPAPPDLHGPISLGPAANRVYFAYGPGDHGVLQIVDRARLLSGPAAPTAKNLLYPQVGRLDLSPLYGAHTSFPLGPMPIPGLAGDPVDASRNIVMVVGEAMKPGCQTPRQMVLFVDATAEAQPMVVSSWTLADPGGVYCKAGGRFGSHASNESFAPVFYRKLAFISQFEAGVRVLDVRDPFDPREVAFYIPAVTDRTCARESPTDPCLKVILTNNVETDERGLIYIVDRANTGLHILRLTGAAAAIANAP